MADTNRTTANILTLITAAIEARRLHEAATFDSDIRGAKLGEMDCEADDLEDALSTAISEFSSQLIARAYNRGKAEGSKLARQAVARAREDVIAAMGREVQYMIEAAEHVESEAIAECD